MIKIWIPSMPQRSYAYRQGDAQIIHDDKGHAIVIDGGEDALCNQIIRYCKNHGITHITYILSHWHYDHDRGLKLLLDSSLIVDKIYCPPPSDLTRLRDSDARDDYSRAMTRIAQAKNLNKPISYPPADAYTTITVGEIVCKIWRRSPKTSENVDYQVNNTSLCCYFPQLSYVTTGDTINAFDTFLATLHENVKVFKVPHHGNACTTSPCKALKALGAELCWYNHAEAAGVGIGGDGFSKWGAGYCKQYFTVLRPFYAITMIAADKTLTVMQNGSTWRFGIPYEGKAEQRWFQTSKGWWYQYSDGSWAVGWKLIEGKWYYFDHNGWMQTGWIRTNGYWYYLDPESGAMQTGWIVWKDAWFYLDPTDGHMHTGWLDYKNKHCYLDGSGRALCDCIRVIDGKTYQFDKDCYATEISEDVLFTKAVGKLNDVGSTRLRFVLDIANYVRKYAPQYGIKVYSPIIAQAIHESGWGESRLAAQYHNYFGMKCGTKWTGRSVNMKTQEEYSAGSLSTISANFRAYDSMEEGVKGYFEFIQLPRYANLKGVTSPRQYLQNIKDDGYATGSQYVDHVMNTLNLYDLTQFDGEVPVDKQPASQGQREAIVSEAIGHIGVKEGTVLHRKIIDRYNSRRPLPRGYAVKYTDAWCATFISYLAIVMGYTDIIPVECGCPQMITLAKQMGIWVEDDAYVPKPGDIVLYDWQDSGSGDNTGTADHIGLVEKVIGSTETIIEGNYQDSVKRREIAVNGRYIRGYIVPRYK